MKRVVLLSLFLCYAATGSAQHFVIDSLQHIVALQRHDSVELAALLYLADEVSRKDIEKAMTSAYRAIALARSLHRVVDICSGYLYLVIFHQNGGKLDSAVYYLKEVESLSKANPSKRMIAINYNQTAGLFYKNQGQYRKALPFMLDNLNRLTAEGEGRAGQFLNVGNTYHQLSDYKNAVKYHLDALRLFEKLNHKRGQSFSLQSLGSDFQSLNRYEQAKGYFQKSLALKEELQDKRGMISSLSGLGDSYKGLKEFTIAETYYTKAITNAREMKLVLEEARALLSLGLLFKQMDNNARAMESITQSLALARSAGDSTLSAKINSERIGLGLSEKKEKGTETALIRTIATLATSGDKGGEAREYARLSDYYASRKQFEKALFYLKKHDETKDSVEGTAVLLQIKQLEEQFQGEKKQKEIELLKKDKELQRLAISRQRTTVILIGIALVSVIVISTLLINRSRIVNRAKREIELEKVRNHIARDLHDDIGSTLSSINIMSQLAMNGDPRQHLRQITEHSAQIMENMSDIVWSINPKNDSIEQVVLKMKEFAVEILEPQGISHAFEVDVSIFQLKFDVEKRKNLFLIYKEAVNNAAKYSGGTEVVISLSLVGKTIHFSIADNGAGFDMALVKSGNGLINMKERAASMGAKLSHHSYLGKGTRLEVELVIT